MKYVALARPGSGDRERKLAEGAGEEGADQRLALDIELLGIADAFRIEPTDQAVATAIRHRQEFDAERSGTDAPHRLAADEADPWHVDGDDRTDGRVGSVDA